LDKNSGAVKLIWATPKGDELLAYMARVSNPNNQDNPSIEGLLKYMLRKKHWSPFDMVDACVEINTTRDIGRQILRHWTARYQEFSQRYAAVDDSWFTFREARLQDAKNRQNSIEIEDCELQAEWTNRQSVVLEEAKKAYKWALEAGIAKEVARCVLPEGMTLSRMYMKASLRTWIHYLQVRTDMDTQKEHRLIAEEIKGVLTTEFPVTMGAAFS
jgi:thymidylate synthase (FAD)